MALEIIVLMVMAKDFYLDAAGSERPSFNDKENRTPGDGQALVF